MKISTVLCVCVFFFSI